MAVRYADRPPWRRRWPLGRATDAQGAAECDVVDVVTGTMGIRAVLSPTGGKPVHELGIEPKTILRDQTEPLSDTRAEGVNETVSRGASPSTLSLWTGFFKSATTER
jgi:hypothetical protein